MGLSNGERIKRVLNSLVGMRKNFDPDDVYMWEDRDDRHLRKHIAAVKESLDQLVGILIQQIDSNGAFWFFGENEDGFRGLTMDYFRAKDQELWKARMDEAMYGEDKDGDFTLREFAHRIGFASRRNIMNLAHWWDMWCWIPSILYGLNRYDDELFKPEFRLELNRLIAKMHQFHAMLREDDYRAEQVLLLKYRLYVDDQYKDERDWTERCDDLRAMTQQELEDEVNRREREKFHRDNDKGKHWEKRCEQKKRGFIDPVVGKVDVTVDGLVEDVEALLLDQEPYHYAKRLDILRALELWDGDAENAAEDLYEFLSKKREHENRYGSEKVKICKMCRLKVLDQRNKTGYCQECLPTARKRGLLKKDK